MKKVPLSQEDIKHVLWCLAVAQEGNLTYGKVRDFRRRNDRIAARVRKFRSWRNSR